MMREDRMRHEDALEALLISAAKAEEPAPTAEDKVLAALGVTGAALTLPLIAAHAAPITKSQGLSLSWKLLAKITGGCVVGSAVALVFIRAPVQDNRLAMAGHAAPLSEVVRQVQPMERLFAPAVDPAPVSSEDMPAASQTAAASSSDQPSRAATKQPTAVRSANPGQDGAKPALEAEVRTLDEARQALRSGQPARALALLNQYAIQFPKPILGSEATAMRIEALAHSGDPSAARILANRFLKANPKSPLADRVRSTAGVPSSL